MIPVKICGITRLEDAQAAVQLGARALGFLCWPDSPRYAAPETVAKIVAALPPLVVTVGVFVRQPLDAMNAVARRAKLDRIQLHGGEPRETLAALERPGWRVFRIGSAADAQAALASPDAFVHLDTRHERLEGGTGQAFNWDWARRVAAAKPVILSGGITPENAAEAVRTVRPAALDVSSGVESAPGIKDHAKLAALFRALAEAPVALPTWSFDHAVSHP